MHKNWQVSDFRALLPSRSVTFLVCNSIAIQSSRAHSQIITPFSSMLSACRCSHTSGNSPAAKVSVQFSLEHPARPETSQRVPSGWWCSAREMRFIAYQRVVSSDSVLALSTLLLSVSCRSVKLFVGTCEGAWKDKSPALSPRVYFAL